MTDLDAFWEEAKAHGLSDDKILELYVSGKWRYWRPEGDTMNHATRCQCGEISGEYCDAPAEISVDYCPESEAGTAAACGSWQGLTCRLDVSRACGEMLRTLYDDDGNATVYPDPYTFAAARDRKE